MSEVVDDLKLTRYHFSEFFTYMLKRIITVTYA